MLYVVFGRDDPPRSAQIRTQFLSEHLQYLDRHAHILLLGGAMLAEDGRTRIGSVLVLNVSNREEAERFSQNEPFRRAGLYASVEINRMRRGQWYPQNVPATADGN